MKRILLSIPFFLMLTTLFAQPANDDCAGIIHLGTAPVCADTVLYNNVDASPSDVENLPDCFIGGQVQSDVWFSFTASDTITDYTITLTGMMDDMGNPPLENPQIAIYRGDCEPGGLAENDCEVAALGATSLEMNVLGLTVNATYFIRVDAFSQTATPSTGAFSLCVEAIDPVNTIDQDGSNACAGELYDSGGPDGDYSSNENNSFTICPNELVNQSGCIIFELEYYNIEQGDNDFTAPPGGDIISFYDGPNNSGTPFDQLNGFNQFDPITFEDAPQTGGGGVCYRVQASSGCLTVNFQSDATVNMEGWAASWYCTTENCENPPPISVTENATEQEIIDNISSPLTTVTVDSIVCAEGSYGTFEGGDNTNLGLDKGLLLTSGSAAYAQGVNTSNGGLFENPFSDNFAPGDADLDSLSVLNGGNLLESENACAIYLDVFVGTNELTFEYVFGSEEYPEFVNLDPDDFFGNFNDIFAFLIKGDGIVGDPGLNDQKNIALIPGSNDPVEINSVNNILNWEYYRNNSNGQSLQYDGFTSDYLGSKKSLTARAEVIPCNNYKIKLAIADRGDATYDSGVFISEIKGGVPSLAVNYFSGVEYLIEDCSGDQDQLIINLSSPLDEDATYDVQISGTATPDVDYELDIPGTITIPAGQTVINFPIKPLLDNIDEGIETIEIALTNDFGCGVNTVAEILIEIHDEPQIEIQIPQDTVFLCQDSSLQLNVTGADTYFWRPPGILDDASIDNPIASPTEDILVTVEGTVGICTAYDSIFLDVVGPELTLQTTDPINICNGESVNLIANNNISGQGIMWLPEDGINDPTSDNVIATPTQTTIYTASVSASGCTASDQITITVEDFDFPTLIPDTVICEGESVQLANNIIGTTTYNWTPNQDLDQTNISGPTASPLSTTTYTLNASSPNGACSQTESVTVSVTPADLEIDGDETRSICKGEASITLTTSSLSGGTISWFPTEGLNTSTGDEVIATPEVSTLYIATLTNGPCSVSDSVFINVDSLPDLAITALPDQTTYCVGETVSLISDFNPNDYPNIQHQWSPANGAVTPLDNANLVIETASTITYTRISTNGLCSATETITINVVDPVLQTSWTDTTICANESVDAFITNGTNIQWSPTTGLSCTDCPDPTISLSDSMSYTIQAEIDGCPVSTTINVNVVPIANIVEIQFDPDQEIPQGEDVNLTVVTDPDVSGSHNFVWTHNGTALTDLSGPMINYTIIEESNLFEVTVTDPVTGCPVTESILITGLEPTYGIPSAFTPDNDGVNDRFLVVRSAESVVINNFVVYNRWGQSIFDSVDPDGWDGKHNGKLAPSDVYIYLIELSFPDGRVEKFQGDVTLIR